MLSTALASTVSVQAFLNPPIHGRSVEITVRPAFGVITTRKGYTFCSLCLVEHKFGEECLHLQAGQELQQGDYYR